MPRVKKLNLGIRPRKGRAGHSGRIKGQVNVIKDFIEKKVECLENQENLQTVNEDDKITYEAEISPLQDDVTKLIDEKLKAFIEMQTKEKEELRKQREELRKQRELKKEELRKQKEESQKLKEEQLEKKYNEDLEKQRRYFENLVLKMDKESITSKIRDVKKIRYNQGNLML